jgi:peptidoglycan hydrolase-like protein with peptidoglycan-binding domain
VQQRPVLHLPRPRQQRAPQQPTKPSGTPGQLPSKKKPAKSLEKDAATLRSQVSLKGYPADKVNPDGTVVKADQNAVKAWRETMGVPETPDKYDIKLPTTSPYPQFQTYLQSMMHEAGVPAAMAPALAKGYEAAVTRLETELRERETTDSKLKLAELERAWGSQYAERTSLAQRGKEWIAKEAGGITDTQLRTMESVLGTDKFMTMLWKFGAGNKEPGFAGSSGSPSGFQGSASAAQAALDQLTADRVAGKVTTEAFRTKQIELTNIIIAGMKPQA